MTRVRRNRFLTIALAVCLAGAAAPYTLMAQGAPGMGAYGHSHKKHKKQEKSAQEMAKKTESHWKHKEMATKKVETKKAETHANRMGQKPPRPGMVWVNTNTKIYHSAGSKYYGNTKHGKWMTESEARKAGYKGSKN